MTVAVQIAALVALLAVCALVAVVLRLVVRLQRVATQAEATLQRADIAVAQSTATAAQMARFLAAAEEIVVATRATTTEVTAVVRRATAAATLVVDEVEPAARQIAVLLAAIRLGAGGLDRWWRRAASEPPANVEGDDHE